MNNYYYSNKSSISDNEIAFAEGRQRLPLDKNLHVKLTLGWYSRFFYDRSPDLNKAISSVKFKKEYKVMRFLKNYLNDIVFNKK